MPKELPNMVVRYGRVNREMLARWLAMAPDEGGAFWALNLMKYREVADYGDGPASTKSGREADDEYTPRESLAAIGAEIVFAANVERVLGGDGTAWDRIGIVRYPTRKKFLEMQQRDDFKKQHVHKDAGMEFTIVMSCLPRRPFPDATERHPFVELCVTTADAAPAAAREGTFDVEGVIVGDERQWKTASFRWLGEEAASAEPAETADPSTYVLLLRPMIDRLSGSIREAE